MELAGITMAALNLRAVDQRLDQCEVVLQSTLPQTLMAESNDQNLPQRPHLSPEKPLDAMDQKSYNLSYPYILPSHLSKPVSQAYPQHGPDPLPTQWNPIIINVRHSTFW
jgi:hypothetical protein